jgi:hypothetical protein
MSFAGIRQFDKNLRNLMADKNFDVNKPLKGLALLNSKYGKGSKISGKVEKLPGPDRIIINGVRYKKEND